MESSVEGLKMRQVFTLWPEVNVEQGGSVDQHGMPVWATDPGPSQDRARWHAADVLLVCLIALLAGAMLLAGSPADAFGIALGLGIVATVLAFIVYYRRTITGLQRRLDESIRWNDTIFERTGIALWREDWSFARDEVLRLLRSGVRDMQAHFAAHPHELRAIRKSVIIKDVNSSAVARAGATSKDSLIGSLDRILPDTDQTFVQWLVAFARGDDLYRSETHLTDALGNPVDTLFTAGLPKDMRGFEDILVSDLDITEYKATQSRLAQAELDIARAARVTTMGALSASIAHEVSSPLAAIGSHAAAGLRWIERDQPELDEAAESLRSVVAATARAQAVIERTRAFLSNSSVAPHPHDIVPLIQEAILLIERELRALGASVHFDLRDGMPKVLADPVNMQQVIVNLALNAAQAMSTLQGPRDILISAFARDGCVRVEITDRGPGIDPDTMKSMFEPFYSTKDGGMGMGLAICRNCILAHGGRLWATSSLGEGATFHVELKAALDQAGE